MSVRRIMTDLPGREPRRPGWQPMIDLRRIAALADPAWPGVRLSPISHDETAPVLPALPIEVDQDTAYAACSPAVPDGDVAHVPSRR